MGIYMSSTANGRISGETIFTIDGLKNTGAALTSGNWDVSLGLQPYDKNSATDKLTTYKMSNGYDTWYSQYSFNFGTDYYQDESFYAKANISTVRFGQKVVPLLSIGSNNYRIAGNEDTQATYISTINAAYIDCKQSYSAGQTFDKKISYGWSKPQQVTWTYDGELSDGDIVLTSGHHTICAILEYALPEYSEVLEIELDVN